MNALEMAKIELELNESNMVHKLVEALKPATEEFINDAMDNDEELAKFLKTPAHKLPDRYKYLVIELPRRYRNSTLLNVINISQAANFKGYFSVDNNDKLIGYVAYQVENNCITEIKMFSLRPEGNNLTLLKDLDLFIQESKSKYKKIQWTAVKENVAACKMYDFAIKKYKGRKEDWIDPETGEVDQTVWEYIFINSLFFKN
jgi:hypothetical protein